MANTDYDAFLAEYSSVITDLAEANWTITEAYARFTTMFPKESKEHLATALESGKWTFVGRREQPLTNMMMSAALWFAIGYTLDLEPDYSYAAVSLDAALVADIPRAFDTAGLTPEAIADVMGVIGAALKYLAERPYTTLEDVAYDELVENPPALLADIDPEKLAWPPARYLIEDRLGEGNWSNALLRTGICPPNADSLGYDIDGSKLTDRAFRNALGDFLSYCIRYDRRPAVLLYGSWASAGLHLGKVPLLSAVRGKYGSWSKALSQGRVLINDALKMSENSAVPAYLYSKQGISSPGNSIDELEAHGIGIVQAGSKETVNQWADLNQVMFKEFSAIPWGGSLKLYYTDTPEDDATPLELCAKVMRTHAGYLCEISEYDSQDELMDLDEDYLHQTGWSEPHNGYEAWTQNFFSVGDAAYYVVGAMRDGLGCTNRAGYFSENGSAANESRALHPSVPQNPAETTIESSDN